MVSDYAMTNAFRGARLHLAMQNPVGASLLAKGPCQSKSLFMTNRIREQARSHIGMALRACDIGATVRRILSG